MSTTVGSKRPSYVKAMPRVSVIVPTYNRHQFLGQALDSVLAQTYPYFELIVVDDGSDDPTPDLLAAYGETIQVIRQSNQGVSSARNTGIQASKGEWIALLDSDDYWLPQKLESQIALFKSHPGALICQTEEIWIRNGTRVNPKRRHQKFSGMIFEKCLPLCLVSPSAVMLHKTLFDEIGLFDENLPACEDYDLWLRMTWKYPVHLIDTPFIVKRGGHADQLSRMAELDKYRIQALVKILGKGCLSESQHKAAQSILAQKCAIFANGCRKRGRFDQAAHYERLPESFKI